MNVVRSDLSRRQRRTAFTIPELIIVGVVLALLICVALPWLVRGKRVHSRLGCINNLEQVGLAFRIFSGDNDDKYPMGLSVTNGGFLERLPDVAASDIFLVTSNELGIPRILVCPEDTERHVATDFGPGFSDRTVSYFVGLDANLSGPWVLAGDRNLTADRKPIGAGPALLATNQTLGWTSSFHRGYGNLCFGDGSVQQVGPAQLQKAFNQTGLATNRLAVP